MYWHYIKEVFRHKSLVFVAGSKLAVPFHKLIIHDLSRLFPSELIFRAKALRDNRISGATNLSSDRSRDRFHHFRRNRHHWQHWVLISDNRNIIPMPMPIDDINEMLADWMALDYADTDQWSISSYYRKHSSQMLLNYNTRREIENLIDLYWFIEPEVHNEIDKE